LLEDKIETIVKEIEKAGKSGNIKEAAKQLKLLEDKNTELATLKVNKYILNIYIYIYILCISVYLIV